MKLQENLIKFLQELQITATRHYKDNLVSLVVFGSVAKGKATPESDIDLLVILNPQRKGERFHIKPTWTFTKTLRVN